MRRCGRGHRNVGTELPPVRAEWRSRLYNPILQKCPGLSGRSCFDGSSAGAWGESARVRQRRGRTPAPCQAAYRSCRGRKQEPESMEKPPSLQGPRRWPHAASLAAQSSSRSRRENSGNANGRASNAGRPAARAEQGHHAAIALPGAQSEIRGPQTRSSGRNAQTIQVA